MVELKKEMLISRHSFQTWSHIRITWRACYNRLQTHTQSFWFRYGVVVAGGGNLTSSKWSPRWYALDDLGTTLWEILVSPPVFVNSCYLFSKNFSHPNEQSKLRLIPLYLAVISLIEDWNNTYSVKNLGKN